MIVSKKLCFFCADIEFCPNTTGTSLSLSVVGLFINSSTTESGQYNICFLALHDKFFPQLHEEKQEPSLWYRDVNVADV